MLFEEEIIKVQHVSDMAKQLRKAIMKRSELETKYFKDKTQESFFSYKK